MPDRRDLVERAVSEWVSQLVDLGGRNRLLFFRDQKMGTIRVGGPGSPGIDRLLARQPVSADELFEDPAEAWGRLRRIAAAARENFEEAGVETLYLAVGLVTWRPTRSASIPAAPVLLYPLKIRTQGRGGAGHLLEIVGDPVANPALLLAMKLEFGIGVDEADLIKGEDSALPSLDRAQWVLGNLTAASQGIQGWSIDPSALIVSNFSYQKLPMVSELEGHVDAFAEHDLIAAMAGDGEAVVQLRRVRDGVDPSESNRSSPDPEFIVLDADASQSRVIRWVLAGHSLVIDGPPGTGKSQTIANLVVSLAATGKSVLFVAEKRAAIDAVGKRLRAVGLDDLVLDLHGRIASRRQASEALGAALRAADLWTPSEHAGAGLEGLETQCAALDNHLALIHEPRDPWRLSVADVIDRLAGVHDAPTITRPLDEKVGKRLDRDRLAEAVDLVVEYGERGGFDRSPWSGLKDVGASAVARARVQVRMVLDAASNLLRQLRAVEPDVAIADQDPELVLETLRLLHRAKSLLGRLEPRALDRATDVSTMLAVLDRGSAGGDAFDVALREARSLVRPGKPRMSLAELAMVLRGVEAVRRGLAARLPGLDPTAIEACSDSGLSLCIGAAEQLQDGIASLRPEFRDDPVADATLEHLEPVLTAMIESEARALGLGRLRQIGSRLSALGLDDLLTQLETDGGDPVESPRTAEKACLMAILDAMASADQRLAAFDGNEHRARIDRFKQGDRRFVESNRDRVRNLVMDQLAQARRDFPAQESLLLSEAGRVRGHRPLRDLVGEASELLLALRPCWAMSPLMVSQVLPPMPGLFDVVIFDEASQVLPADAVPAILRGTQTVVAGDRRQLPPTTFFMSGLGEGDDWDDSSLGLTTGFESILDIASALLPAQTLRWHYRSEDDSLIGFSNEHVYHGSLATFPGILRDSRVTSVVVDAPAPEGRESSNPSEIERVVDLVWDHARNRPSESLGVIGLGIKHAAEINDAVLARLDAEPDGQVAAFITAEGNERFFVKNLERVQGDERDAIILSIGYAKNQEGELRHHFGPLNHEGGWRRLNVAITRARKRMTVVSSFRHSDLDLGRTQARGVRMLKDYLRYADGGERTAVDPIGDDRGLSRVAVALGARLRRDGLQVAELVGRSGSPVELGIGPSDGSGVLTLAVETDGFAYRRTPTARDRDRLRAEMLERLGWTHIRVSALEWARDPEGLAAMVSSHLGMSPPP